MFYRQNRRTSGFTLVELAIVLGVAGVLFGGLWRLLSTSNQQMRDQATANQHAQLVAAVGAYLQSSGGTSPFIDGQAYLTKLPPSTSQNLILPTAVWPAANNSAACANAVNAAAALPAYQNGGICNFLPAGFSQNTVNPYGQRYRVRVLKDNSPAAPASYSFVVMTITTAGETIITDTSGGRISALIGGDGGFLYNVATCPAAAPSILNACGSYGGWLTAPVATYGFAAAPVGHVASRTFVSSSQTASDYWLARRQVPGDTTFANNTMQAPADLYLGGQDIIFNNFAGTSPGGQILLGTTGTISGNGTVIGSNPSITLVGNMGNGAAPSASNPLLRLRNLNAALPLPNQRCLPAVNSSTGNVSVTNCNFTLEVNGSMTVTDFLYANQFYSPSFGYFSSSDRRLKTDIMPLSGSLAKIMEIKPVSFTLKADGKVGLGVIAQDLEKIYPQLVSDGPNGYKAVAYNGLIAPLVEAVQELKKQNDQLHEQLRAQEQSQKEMKLELERLQRK